MTLGRARLVAAGLLTVGLLAGCSGADEECPSDAAACAPPSPAPTSDPGVTPPSPSSPSGSVPPPTTGLPETLSPSTGSGVPIPIPSQPAN